MEVSASVEKNGVLQELQKRFLLKDLSVLSHV
jgi:hypothetical protein